MYLHLGQDTVITIENILGIFDLETTTVSKATRDYLSKATKDRRVVTVSSELPKSFVVCRNENGGTTVYVSPISPSTLLKRSRTGISSIRRGT
ncbi:MAG: DUF370 domain-containing protein [Clostridia bacterium]|nr:DUF370 domain-containing protein [Clostridia bacterium]